LFIGITLHRAAGDYNDRIPVVVPVGPGEDDMPQFDERDLPQA